MKRKDNEVLIPTALLADLLAAGTTHGYTIEDGPRRGDRITGIRTVENGEEPPVWAVVEYERPVHEVLARNTFGGIEFRSTSELMTEPVAGSG